MPILDLKQRFDITPTTALLLPGNGRVEFALDGSIDVPNPLVAQQIYDALKKISIKAEEVLQNRFDAGAHKGWKESQSAKAIDSVLNNFYDRATKAIDKVIHDYVKMNADFKVIQRQDYAKVASTSTSVVLKVGKLVISGGTDVVAWASLAKTIYKAAKLLHDAVADIPKVDEKSREAVQKACKYYREKYLRSQESTWDKFKKRFSDPLKKAKENNEKLQTRLVRAEKPCHQMAEAIEAGLRLQDQGEVTEEQARKLNQLLIAVSETMGKVEDAKENLENMRLTMELLDADIDKFKTKNKPKKSTPFEHVKNNMDKKVKELKKWTDERAVKDWASAAKNVAKIAKDFA